MRNVGERVDLLPVRVAVRVIDGEKHERDVHSAKRQAKEEKKRGVCAVCHHTDGHG